MKNDANFSLKNRLRSGSLGKAIKFIEFTETINYATFEVEKFFGGELSGRAKEPKSISTSL